MRDRASVNNVAMQTLKVIYPTIVDVGCFSNIIDHVREKFDCETLGKFMTLWISMFSQSPKCSHKASNAFIWRCGAISA